VNEQITADEPTSKWIRILYMLLFFACYKIAEFLMLATTIFQLIVTLIGTGPNEHALRFGRQLAEYAAHCWRYLTYNSEERPFPFAPWPSAM
jgi:hypothetical protein